MDPDQPIETAIYEQCPFDWNHVSQIYLSVKTEPEDDGIWRTLTYGGTDDVVYRRRNGYFQFFSGKRESSLFQELLTMEPLPSYDSAEWNVEKHDEGCYLVRTGFSETFGPCEQQRLLDELIKPYGMWLECRGTHVSGATTFGAIDSELMWFACRRITMLEAWCIDANRRITNELNSFWGQIREQVANEIATEGEPILMYDSSSEGGKRRVPGLPTSPE